MFKLKNKKYDYDLIVIGSGAGGSVGAHYARALGKKVAIFEKGEIGGECPSFACVPTKALLHAGEVYNTVQNAEFYGINASNISVDYHAVREWKNLVVSRTGAEHGEEAFKGDGIDLIRAHARFISPHHIEADSKVYSAAKFIIATGSKVFVPPIPGIEEAGYITFEKAVDLDTPPASLLIFGAGPVGCEFAHIFSTFGSRVILVNRSEKILGNEEPESAGLMQAIFENQGITVLTGTTMLRAEKKGEKKIVHLKQGTKEFTREIDQILIATGKVPSLDCGLEKAGVTIEKGRFHVNRYLQTNVPHIYAAGDIIGPYLFTHTGYYQSHIAAHNAFSNNKMVPDYRTVPRCVFTSPEIASVGMTEAEATEKGLKPKKGLAEMAVLGRSNTSNEFNGFVKVITDAKGTIIGGSIVAPRAGEMVHELALAVRLRVHYTVLAEMIHAYPTYSEAIKIACSNVE